MGESYNSGPRLPKNIRQIGDRDDVVKLYVEDYVNTYLKRLFPSGGQELRIGLLLGTSEICDGVPYLFVDGALEMEEVSPGGKPVFSEAAWKKAYQRMEETFPKRTVQGWFLCGPPGCMLSPLNYWRQHNQYFGGKNQLMYLNSAADGEEAFYVTSEDGFYRLRGYSIYYERNQLMQDYLIQRKDARRVETGAGTGDQVVRDFRSRMETRRQEAASRYGTIRTLGTLCAVLAVAVLAGGVTLFNNYQKMREMESVLVSVLPKGIAGEAGRENAARLPIVEEIRAGLSAAGRTGGTEEAFPEADGEETGADPEAAWEAAAPVSNSESTGSKTSGAGSKASGAGDGSAGAADTESGAADTGSEAPGAGSEVAGAGDGSAGAADTESGAADTGSSAADTESGAEGAGSEAAGAGDGAPKEPYVLPEPELQRDMPPSGDTYLIGEGETLFGICFKLYGNLDYLDEIRALNELDDADRIIAGQTLILPEIPKAGAQGQAQE